MTHPARTERFAALDLLRLVAAMSVVFFHYGFRGAAGDAPMMDQGYPEIAGIAIYGYLGVSLFFMISGFVIAWSAEGRSWLGFAIARFARIYPGFILCMTVSALVMAWAADPRFPVTIVQYLANWTLLPQGLGQPFVDGVYWSIVMELIFYGWMAVAILTGQFERRPLVLIVSWLALSMLNEWVIGSEAMRKLFITEFSGWFAAGILTWHMRSRGVSAMAIALFAVSFVMALATSFAGREWMDIHYAASIPAGLMPVAVLGVFAVFLATVLYGHRVPATGLTLALGGLTYPLYLLHQHIGYIGLNTLSPSVGRWSALAIVTLGALVGSYLIWALAERPLHRELLALLKRLTRPLPAHWLQPRKLAERPTA